MAWIGVAFDPIFAASNAFCWAITAIGALWRGAINLVQHGIINIGAERAFNGFLGGGFGAGLVACFALGRPGRNKRGPGRAAVVVTCSLSRPST